MKQGWITLSSGAKYHYVDDKIHNDDGPAVIYSDGTKSWFKHNKRHRDDGPAFENANGNKAWYYEDKYLGHSLQGYTQEKFEQWKKFKIFL